MRTEHITDKDLGKLLRITNGKTLIDIALEYGIRVVRMCCVGMENLLYTQPKDLSDGLTTPQGWRLRGGHRFWSSPESDLSYFPDNDPVAVTEGPECVIVRQNIDPWLSMVKELRIRYTENGSIEVTHILTNRSNKVITAAAWGVTTLRGGGVCTLPFPRGNTGEYTPQRVLSIWGHGSLADPRLTFTEDSIVLKHIPLDHSLKLGVYNREGYVEMTNLGQRFRISFDPKTLPEYSDNGCNTEVFLDPHIMELETLGTLTEMQPGAQAVHTENWMIMPC